MTTRTRKLILLCLLLMLGAAILAPIVMAFDPDRMPGDFIFSWGKQHYLIPVIWSLCVSAGLGLLYFFYRR
jgi:hypothetical protein